MHPGIKSLLSVPQRGTGEARPHGGRDGAFLSSESMQSSREEDKSPRGVIRGVRCLLRIGGRCWRGSPDTG